MPYDDHLADRINQIMNEKRINFHAKKMMGGLLYMVDDKMFLGIHFSKKMNTDLLMARIGEEASVEAIKLEGCHPMDFTGRPMKGYVFVDPDGYDLDEQLEKWIEYCQAFNPFAKSSKKKI